MNRNARLADSLFSTLISKGNTDNWRRRRAEEEREAIWPSHHTDEERKYILRNMGVTNESLCSPNHRIVIYPGYLAVTMPALVSPVICIILMATFAFRFHGKGCYHPNAKILLFCQLLFTTLYSCVFLYTHGAQLLYNILFHFNDVCCAINYAGECTIAYYSTTISVTGMVATQVCIGIERIVSTVHVRNYEKFGMSLGVSLALFAILLSLAVSLIVLLDFDPDEVRITCMGVPASTGDRSRLLYYVIIACDILTMALFLVSLRLNDKHNETHGQYILGAKYQQKENRNVIRMLFPNVIAHCLVYCSFSIAAFLIRTYHESFDPLVYACIAVVINLVPHYTVVELIVLHSVLTKLDKKMQKFQLEVAKKRPKEDKEAYFAEYTKAWN